MYCVSESWTVSPADINLLPRLYASEYANNTAIEIY